MSKEMLRIRLPLILVAIALVVAKAECMTMCGAASCGHSSSTRDSANIPPCHRHHAPEQTETPGPCGDSLLLVENRASSPVPANESAGMTLFALPQRAADEFLIARVINRSEAASPPRPTLWTW